MAALHFAKALQRHVDCPSEVHDGTTVREVLDAYFAAHPEVRGYVLDDRGRLRRHVTVFVGSTQLDDPVEMSDAVDASTELYVMQALSGGER
jgi:molybdopterin synthase sulfur carrier subunit